MRKSNVDYKFLNVLGISLERYMSLEDLDNEIWKPIPEYELYYEASTMGRIKVLERETSYNKTKGMMREHILKPKTNGYKYWTVGLCINGKTVYKYIHRLVASTFIPNPENKPEVDHLNTDTNDNRLENLSWATHMENQYNPITRFRKLEKESEDNPIVQLSIIGEKLSEWKSIREASYFTGISDTNISGNIVYPKRYYSAGGYIFMKKEDFDNGKFELPLLNSSSNVIKTGIPSKLTIVLFLRGNLVNVFPSNTIAAQIFNMSPSTVSTMCKHNIKGRYKSNEIQFKFFKDLSVEEQMAARIMLLNKRR